MNLRQISGIFYAVGFCLVVGSWINLVSPAVGWIGWVIAMLGWGAQFLPGMRKLSVADELQKLENLRQQGTISEEQFEAAKARLLA